MSCCATVTWKSSRSVTDGLSNSNHNHKSITQSFYCFSQINFCVSLSVCSGQATSRCKP
jgi:hypothetical protein